MRLYLYRLDMKNKLKKSINTYVIASMLILTSIFSGMLLPTIAAHAASTGGTVGKWQTQTNALPLSLLAANSIVYNGYVYVFGGFNPDNGDAVNTVFSAQIDSAGNVGEWNGQGNTPMPISLFGSSAVVYNGYVFIIGGTNNTLNAPTRSIYSAPLVDGAVGEWTTYENNLPIALGFQTIVEENGYLYLVDGASADPDGNFILSNSVFSAPINNNGTLGSWTQQANFPDSRSYSTSVAQDGYLYIFGGNGSGSTIFDTVYSAPITDGHVGTWTQTNSMPQPMLGSVSVVYGGKIYLLGGDNGTGNSFDTVFSATLNNGSAGTWKNEGNSLPSPLFLSTSGLNNGYVYVVGGGNSNGILNTVYSAQLFINSLDQSASVLAGTHSTIPILSGAIDNPDPSSLTILTQPLHGTATAGTDGITYTPANSFNGSDSLTYRICSDAVSSRCSIVTLNLTVALQPPNTGFGETLSNPMGSFARFVIAGVVLLFASYATRKRYTK